MPRGGQYELVLPFGDLPVGTILSPTGKDAFDFLAGGATTAIEVEIDGRRQWLHARSDGPLRVRKVEERPA
jgi:hypothetical protein